MSTLRWPYIAPMLLAGVSLFPVARAQNIEPFYASEYTITNIGMIDGLPENYGPVIFKCGEQERAKGDSNVRHFK
jgi:hypothetical protein